MARSPPRVAHLETVTRENAASAEAAEVLGCRTRKEKDPTLLLLQVEAATVMM